MTEPKLQLFTTGVKNFDTLLGGGLPVGSITVLAGPPGAGKTILAQQIAFRSAAAGLDVLYFHTLSEPTAKTLRFLREFSYFDPSLLETRVKFVDLGLILRARGLAHIGQLIMSHVERTKPAVVIIDSFKIFDDLTSSMEELRKFGYEIAIGLMAWECTTILLGEYAASDYESNPLFSIVDGLVTMAQVELAGEHQRIVRVVKMRGADHLREPASFAISRDGLEIFTPRSTAEPTAPTDARATVRRFRTGIVRLDELLAEGVPAGSSLLVSGASGTGKTAMLLEIAYRGATAYGEKSLFFAFEETEARLRASGRGFGWEIDAAIESGKLEIVSVPQPDIRVEPLLARMRDRIAATGAKRVCIDSLSLLLHNIDDAQLVRDKVWELAAIVQSAGAIGLFATDTPFGGSRLSRFGVEETVVDGVIVLTSAERGLDRQRFLEIYKLRNTAHLKGRHSMTLGPGGMAIFPRYAAERDFIPPHPFDVTSRLSIGIDGVDRLLGGGVLERSVTLVSGSTGIGKSTFGMQFALAGARCGEHTLYIAREEGPKQILASAAALGLPLQAAVDEGLIEFLYLSREDIRGAQLFTILGDNIRARNVRRLVLDSATRLESDDLEPEELPRLLYMLVAQFKTLGVTSMLTLESKNMFATNTISDQGLSPIADNVIMLRYGATRAGLEHTLAIVKTRGSPHRAGTFAFTIAPGGIVLGEAVTTSVRMEGGASS